MLLPVPDARPHPPLLPAHLPPSCAAPSGSHDPAPGLRISNTSLVWEVVLYAVSATATRHGPTSSPRDRSVGPLSSRRPSRLRPGRSSTPSRREAHPLPPIPFAPTT